MIYLAMFGMSFIFMLIGSSRSIQYKFIKKGCYLVALALPITMAALRADTVGTDLKVYVILFYQKAVVSNTFDELYSIFNYQLLSDPGYFIVTWLCAQVSKDYHFGLFVYELIMIVFLYLGLKRYNKIPGIKISIPIAVLLYYLMSYNTTLNIVRQMLAVSIVFFAVSYLFERNIKAYIIISVIAILMHSSGIITIPILIMYLFLTTERKMTDKKSLQRGIIFVLCLIGVIFWAENAINFLVNHKIIRVNYLNYLSGGAYETSRVAFSVLMAPTVYFVLAVLNYGYIKRKEPHSLFLLMCTLINFIAAFGSGVSVYLSRFSHYFTPFVIILLLKEIESLTKQNKKQWRVLVVCVACVFWIFDTLIRNYGDTLPYVMR